MLLPFTTNVALTPASSFLATPHAVVRFNSNLVALLVFHTTPSRVATAEAVAVHCDFAMSLNDDDDGVAEYDPRCCNGPHTACDECSCGRKVCCGAGNLVAPTSDFYG